MNERLALSRSRYPHAVGASGQESHGYYLAHEVGWLAGVSGDRIGQWARRGYIRSSVSSKVPRIYSYEDVAEAMVVHELLDRGVPLQKIRQAIQILRTVYGEWPLTHAPVVTAQTRLASGQTAAALALEQAEGGLTDLDQDPLQGVLELGDLRRIADHLRRGGWAVRELPNLRHVEVDPDRLSGRPAIKGTRVPAELVAHLARTPDGQHTLKRDYDISDKQIVDARRWWNAVESFAAAA
jgi:uncharacterized protein (DUF433 family)/DNA-binding transcriptional MerR regulator